ncbi:MAG: hypothetical protein WD187_03775 [Candidatus Woykebacteria bacterium]
MSLPIKLKQLILGILITVILFAIPTAALAQSTRESPAGEGAQTQNSQPQYYIVPIPKSGEETGITPIPLPSDDPRIQQAAIWDDLANAFGAIAGGIANIAGDVVDCVLSAPTCVMGGLLGLFDYGMSSVETFALRQTGGEASVEAVAVAASGNPVAIQEFLDRVLEEDNPASFGLLGFAGSSLPTLLAMPLPINSTQYVASINPFTTANAAIGDGFNDLSDSNIILNIWTKVRDVSYILAVAVLVIIGFMIMLRVPIGPRNVVSLQNTLPRIAIALLLVTFSFTISGVMIDFVRLLHGVLDSLVDVPITSTAGLLGFFVVMITSLTGALFVTGGLAFGAILFILLLTLLLAIAILIVFIMIAFKLITRYVIFLLLTIFAPLFFIFGAIPKAEGAVIYWFRRAAAALVAIPVTSLVIQLSFAIGFSPISELDFLAIPDLELTGGAAGVFLSWIFLAPVIGLGMFFYATKVPDMVDQIFDIKPGPRGGIGPGIMLAPIALAGKGVRLASDYGRSQQGVEALGRTNIPIVAPIAKWAGKTFYPQGHAGRNPAGPATMNLEGDAGRTDVDNQDGGFPPGPAGPQPGGPQAGGSDSAVTNVTPGKGATTQQGGSSTDVSNSNIGNRVANLEGRSAELEKKVNKGTKKT